ncbi:V-type ATP synthase subunit C [Halohasta salina]|uniref:V-type ATP synthase subunit C n=1 Tax=Halohasta salina TaxID=2961621 RepID=UPI0020A55F5D|nr:V-type ATP synthase subunit C [Halohasta salina]
MSTTGSSNPEYVNARVRARRAALFSDDEYRKLVRMTPSEIARYMEESEYEREINELGSRHSGVDLIEYSLNRNLAKHFNDLLGFSEGRMYDLIARYLRKFDAWNVKTIMRGVYSGADRESIETDLIRAGEFDESFLDRLLEASTIEDVITSLDGTIFGDPLEAALEDFEETDVLVPLENAVDRTFYEELLADLPSSEAIDLYREFLEAEIDFRNARNALRLARSGADIDPAEYFIEGGRLFNARELEGLVQSPDQLVSTIRDSSYGRELSGPLDELEDADSLIAFERALESVLLKYSRRLGNVYPLSICPVVAYILMKEREVENIRAIARGREAGLSEAEIEGELVIL